MDLTQRKLMRAISQNLSLRQIKGRRFEEERDHEAFLREIANISDAKELAVATLVMLCESEKPDFIDRAILVAVVDFLDDAIGVPKNDEPKQRLIDLLKMYPNSAQQYRKWADSWYG
ncbi:MAG: hypothetical protein HYS13_18075 [Planctomycetia bacterium]|nr:hypothetical protein [Planctomycetia bacterium]